MARELSGVCGVLEPLQTAASIEGQILELHALLTDHGDMPLCMIGWSWGAWLGFMFTARYPADVRKLVLVGSGPFEDRYAPRIMKTRLDRLPEGERREVEQILKIFDKPGMEKMDARLSRFGELLSKADSYDPLRIDDEVAEVDFDIYRNVWKEAEELRMSGELLERGKNIRCPVVAIHGDYDPHPYEGVMNPLSSIIRNFNLVLLEKCGHMPWIERYAQGIFYDTLKNELQ